MSLYSRISSELKRVSHGTGCQTLAALTSRQASIKPKPCLWLWCKPALFCVQWATSTSTWSQYEFNVLLCDAGNRISRLPKLTKSNDEINRRILWLLRILSQYDWGNDGQVWERTTYARVVSKNSRSTKYLCCFKRHLAWSYVTLSLSFFPKSSHVYLVRLP